jgi:hypothetical protein
MNRIEWQEDEPDQDGEVAMSLIIISGDPVLLAKARRMFRQLLDDRPNLTTIPRREDGGD